MWKTLAGLTGLGKVLVVIGALVGVSLIVLYAVVTFSSTTVSYRGPGSSAAQDAGYRWEGGPILLETKGMTTTGCEVTPDSGEVGMISSKAVNRSPTPTPRCMNRGSTARPRFPVAGPGTAMSGCTAGRWPSYGCSPGAPGSRYSGSVWQRCRSDWGSTSAGGKVTELRPAPVRRP